MSKEFNELLGQRLREARERLGLSLQEVSKAMGFGNYQTLSSIENGPRHIKASELAKLSKIYLRDISYFLNPHREEETAVSVLWRGRSGDDKYKIKKQEFLKYCYGYYDLEEKLGLDHRFALRQLNNLTPDDFNFGKIREIATDYYHEMQLGSRPACVLEKVLEEKYNIKIMYLDLDNFGSAASAIGKFGAAILVNSSEAPWRRNYDLAHELFHIVAWNIFDREEIHVPTEEKSIIEKWADAFASNLLLPQDEVIRECESRVKDGRISLLDLIGMAREFVVSTEALLWRLVILKRLREDKVKKLIESEEIKRLNRMHRSGDWGESPPHISVRYINLAFKAYQEGLISKGKLAEYLNTSRGELSNKLLEYGYEEGEVYDEEFAVA